MENQQNERLTYTINDFCRATGVGRTHVYKMVKQGKLRVVKLGARTLIPRDEAERIARGEARQ